MSLCSSTGPHTKKHIAATAEAPMCTPVPSSGANSNGNTSDTEMCPTTTTPTPSTPTSVNSEVKVSNGVTATA